MYFPPDPFTLGNMRPTTSASWTTMDLTSFLGARAGACTGAILYCRSTTSSGTFGLRPYGSSFTPTGRILNNGMSFHYVKLDSEDRCEVYMSDYTKYQVYLWGVTEVGDGAEWLSTPYDVTPGTGSVWEATTDLAAQFTNTPEVVFLLAVNAIASQGRWGCQDIDGPDRYGYHVDLQGYEGGVTFCTSGECELWTSSDTNLLIYAVGALTSGAANKFSSSYDATASNVWEEDIDETANMGANDLAIIYHYHDGTGTDDDASTRCITRQAGQTWDDWTYFHGRRAVPRIAPVNPSDRKFDIKVEDEAILAYIYGSIRDGSTQPPGEIVTHYYNDIAFP